MSTYDDHGPVNEAEEILAMAAHARQLRAEQKMFGEEQMRANGERRFDDAQAMAVSKFTVARKAAEIERHLRGIGGNRG